MILYYQNNFLHILVHVVLTDAITKEYRQELYEMQFFCQIKHISGSVKWPLSHKHNLLDLELFPWEYPINYTFQN